MRLSAVALVALALAGSAAAGTLPLKPDYQCDPATCKPENNCRCASMEAPLPRDQMPQFVLYTHDDGIVPAIYDAVNKAIGDRKNPNGCQIPLTWFALKYDTEGYGCDLTRKLWKAGHEIALHTADHVRLDMPIDAEKESQMKDVRTWFNKTCGIPLEDMVGMRDPFLINNPGTRKVQKEMGLLYDSTINEHWTGDGKWPTSKDGGARLWPYTMDSGIPQNCAATGPDGECDSNERHPGLWEVPVWVLQTSKYPMDAYAMDPGGDVFALLKINFDAAYAGNRAPVPIYMHLPWMSQASNQQYVSKFMDYVLAKDDVWFVTMHQLIDWMRNPIPASEMKARFNVGCQPGGSASVAAKSLEAPVAVPAAAPAAPAATPAAPAAPVADTKSSTAKPAATKAPEPVPVMESGAAKAGPAALAAAALAALALALLA